MRGPRHSIVTFSDSGVHVSQIMDFSLQTHLLTHWVREGEAFSLEEAVRQILLCQLTNRIGSLAFAQEGPQPRFDKFRNSLRYQGDVVLPRRWVSGLFNIVDPNQIAETNVHIQPQQWWLSPLILAPLLISIPRLTT